MNKLVAVLSTAVVGVALGCAYTAFETIKYVKKEQKLFAALQDKCDELKEQVNEIENNQ